MKLLPILLLALVMQCGAQTAQDSTTIQFRNQQEFERLLADSGRAYITLDVPPCKHLSLELSIWRDDLYVCCDECLKPLRKANQKDVEMLCEHQDGYYFDRHGNKRCKVCHESHPMPDTVMCKYRERGVDVIGGHDWKDVEVSGIQMQNCKRCGYWRRKPASEPHSSTTAFIEPGVVCLSPNGIYRHGEHSWISIATVEGIAMQVCTNCLQWRRKP